MSKIPDNLQAVMWSHPVDKLDSDKHKAYVIHQVLMYGSFDDIRWLVGFYGLDVVRKIFLNKPAKIYTKEAFNYAQKFVLGLGHAELKEDKYVSKVF